MFAERSQSRAHIIVYAIFEVERVHAVYADQQDVLAAEGMTSLIVASLIVVSLIVRVQCGSSERRDSKY